LKALYQKESLMHLKEIGEGGKFHYENDGPLYPGSAYRLCGGYTTAEFERFIFHHPALWQVHVPS